uniref:Uncharacterized protein n=1 Tax=Oryza barthii TaxID=65489 RepID=A0A0D3EMR1_9ORYZ
MAGSISSDDLPQDGFRIIYRCLQLGVGQLYATRGCAGHWLHLRRPNRRATDLLPCLRWWFFKGQLSFPGFTKRREKSRQMSEIPTCQVSHLSSLSVSSFHTAPRPRPPQCSLWKASVYILGAAGSNIVFMAVLSDSVVLAVHRINSDGTGASQFSEFDAQMSAIARLHHHAAPCCLRPNQARGKPPHSP